MEITEKIITLDSRWFSAERDVSRTKGLHLSHVIDYIEYLEGKRAKSGGEDLSANGHAYAAAGFCWERLLQNMLERDPTELWDWLFGRVLGDTPNPKIVRPGEQCLDAGLCPICNGSGEIDGGIAGVNDCRRCLGTGRVKIYMTPDGYHIEDVCMEEWKWTSKSSNSDIRGPKFSRWLNYQIPIYLKALLLDTCRLRVYFSRGDYTNGVPQWREYMLKYSQQEIDETWDCIAQHAQIMYREGYS